MTVSALVLMSLKGNSYSLFSSSSVFSGNVILVFSRATSSQFFCRNIWICSPENIISSAVAPVRSSEVEEAFPELERDQLMNFL